MADHISGKDVRAVYRQNNANIVFRFKSIDVEEDAEEVADDCNGEDRSRYQIITNGWKISLGIYMPDSSIIDSVLADITNNDARVTPLVKVIGLKFSLLDGTKVAYKASEVTRSPFKMSASGRKDRVMQTKILRCRYFDKMQST